METAVIVYLAGLAAIGLFLAGLAALGRRDDRGRRRALEEERKRRSS